MSRRVLTILGDGLDRVDLDRKDRLIPLSNLDLSILPISYCYFRHHLAKQMELVNWLFANYPFCLKKDMKGNC